jgi:hypothetical protein
MEESVMKKILAVCTLFVFMFTVHGVAVAGQGNPGIAKATSMISIPQSYADLGAQWWQWALQAPAADTPLFDDGTKCRVGQEGPVWFLAGTLGNGEANVVTERTCDVPVGKAIFFPVINAAYFGFIDDSEDTRTAEYVRATANFCDSNTIQNLSVTIDGIPVNNPTQYYASSDDSPIFQVQLPTDNIASATPDSVAELMFSPSAHQGYYIYVQPLEPGPHTIEWTASWDCTGGTGDLNSENIKYNLNVLPGVTGEVL